METLYYQVYEGFIVQIYVQLTAIAFVYQLMGTVATGFFFLIGTHPGGSARLC